MSRSPSAWLWGLAALSLGYAVHLGGGGPHPISFVLLGVALVATALATGGWQWRPPSSVDRLLLFGVAAECALLLVLPVDQVLQGVGPIDRGVYVAGVAVAAVASASLLMRRSGPSAWLFALVLAVHFALGVWIIGHSPSPFIDVWHFQQEGIDALLNGTNPYRPIYDDIYAGTSPYYGPGIAVDGRLTVGLPYPPLSLLLAMPGKLLAGDHRFAQLAAVELAAIAIFLTRPGRIAAGAALVLLFMPRTFFMAERGFTEPFGVLLLAVSVLVAVRAPRFLGVAVGLVIAVKQYLLLGLPLAILLLDRRSRERWRLGIVATATALVVTAPLALWDLGAFYRSTVEFLALQPYRADSLTFLALAPTDAQAVRSLTGFVLLLPAFAFVAFRSPRTPAMYAGALAFLLLVFFAFGKQGAINYYFMVIGALCVAVAADDWAANGRNMPPELP